MHCHQELESDLGYAGLLPDRILLKWFNDAYSTSKHLLTLYSLARGLNAKIVVEIGFGRSSFVLARATAENAGRLYTCDVQDFSYLLSTQEKAVTEFSLGDSANFWTKDWSAGIDLAFLDYFSAESVSLDFCLQEILRCLSFMKANGLVVLHDAMVEKYQLRQALRLLMEQQNGSLELVTLPYNYGLGIIRYRGPSVFGELEDCFLKKPDREVW